MQQRPYYSRVDARVGRHSVYITRCHDERSNIEELRRMFVVDALRFNESPLSMQFQFTTVLTRTNGVCLNAFLVGFRPDLR
jgi:hypothetical protein